MDGFERFHAQVRPIGRERLMPHSALRGSVAVSPYANGAWVTIDQSIGLRASLSVDVHTQRAQPITAENVNCRNSKSTQNKRESARINHSR